MCIMWGDVLRWAKGVEEVLFLSPSAHLTQQAVLAVVSVLKPVMYLQACAYIIQIPC